MSHRGSPETTYVYVKVAQSCVTLCDSMDCSLPGSSVHGILQARILESFLSPQYLPDPEIDLESPTRICLQSRRPQFDSWFRKISWRRDRLPTPVFLSFPCGSAGKGSACNAGDLGLIPGWEDPLEKGKATHSSILAWRIPWTVQCIGLQRVQHD